MAHEHYLSTTTAATRLIQQILSIINSYYLIEMPRQKREQASRTTTQISHAFGLFPKAIQFLAQGAFKIFPGNF
tara:strand:- start:5357 stop:5578 length:222 start_codon:yes stop_codon:yes gene_type:complete